MNNKNNKFGFLEYVAEFNLSFILTAPFIYSLIIPIILLHLFVEVYQRFCFPVYGIKLVNFRNYFNFDRFKICYLSWAEKINCLYCDYANGCFAYVSEVAARTEKFWCPIKHKNRRKSTHEYYDDFVDYFDDKNFRKNKKDLRK